MVSRLQNGVKNIGMALRIRISVKTTVQLCKGYLELCEAKVASMNCSLSSSSPTAHMALFSLRLPQT